VPEEVPIVAAGILSHAGVFRWWLALPVILAGVLAGDAVLYWAGRHWGELLLDWRVVRRVLSRAREERLKAAYREHGAKIVFTARHVMGLRAAAFLTAGIARVPFWKFLAVDAAAAVLSGSPTSSPTRSRACCATFTGSSAGSRSWPSPPSRRCSRSAPTAGAAGRNARRP